MSLGGGRAPPERADLDWDTLRAGLRLVALGRTRNDDAADEATQEVLARTVALLTKRGISDRDEIARIAHGIARHVLADETRKWARFRRFVSRHGASDESHPEIDALSGLISREEKLRLRHAWQQLSASEREVLRRTLFERRGPAALARELGEAAEATRKRKSRALAHLRKAFFELDEGSAPGHEAGRSMSGHAPDRAAIYDVAATRLRTLG